MKRVLLSGSVLWALVWAPVPAQAGKLEDARDEIRGGDAGERASRSHDHDDDEDDDETDFADILVGLFLEALTDSSSTPPAMSSSPSPSLFRRHDYARYPYADGVRGYLVRRPRPLWAQNGEGASDASMSAASQLRTWSTIAELAGGYVPARVGSFASSLRVQHASRLGGEARARWLVEKPQGERFDHAFLGEARLFYALAQSARLQLRLGIGLRSWLDSKSQRVGPEVMVGMDWFPVEPCVVQLEAAGSRLGEAPVGELRLTVGALIGATEVYVGYRHLHVGDVGLGGPEAGLRWWL